MNKKVFDNCQDAIDECLNSKNFAVYHSVSNTPSMDMHIHNCCELFLNISGGSSFLINGKFYKVSPFSLFYINNYESHKIIADSQPFERYVLKLHPDWLTANSTPETDLAYCFMNRTTKMSHCRNLTDDKANKLIKFFKEFENCKGQGSDIIAKCIVLEILVYVGLIYKNDVSNDMSFMPDKKDTVDEVIGYINSNLNKKLNITDIAADNYISINQLCRIFKKRTGTTISKFINARRIAEAKRLLTSGMSVKETCEEAGFADYAHFIRTFHSLVGMPPKQFAKQNSPQ